MTTIRELRKALQDVPTVLLSPDDQRVRSDALNSLDALERIDVVPTAVVFVGSSGSGKSMLVNELVGHDVSASSVVRPTTERTIMFGGSGPVSLAAESEYVHVPTMRPGLLVIDTPPWEHDPGAVRSAVRVADLIVVVVTPSRYADAAVADLVDALPAKRPSAVMLNRVSVEGEQLAALLAAVRGVFGVGTVVLEEGGSVQSAMLELVDALEIDSVGYERAAVMRSAAAAGARFLARTTAGSAPELAHLASVLERVSRPSAADLTFTILDSWPDTRAELAQDVVLMIETLDREIVDGAGSDVAGRIRSSLGAWSPGPLAVSLDGWRSATVRRFSEHARILWRRRAASDLIDRYAWRVALNPEIARPRRFDRIMAGRLGRVVGESQRTLETLLDGAWRDRMGQWIAAVEQLSAFAPGELLLAADDFGGGGGVDG